MSEFTSWVQAELTRLKWSHAELAERTGVSRALVSRTLRGDMPVSCEFCIRVAAALDVAPAHVLTLAGILPDDVAPANPGPVSLEILRLIETLPPERRQQVLEYVRFILSQ